MYKQMSAFSRAQREGTWIIILPLTQVFLENTIAPDFSGLTKVSTYIFDLSVSKYLEQATNQEQAIQGEKEREREHWKVPARTSN